VSACKIVGPAFLEETSLDDYFKLILTTLFSELVKRRYGTIHFLCKDWRTVFFEEKLLKFARQELCRARRNIFRRYKACVNAGHWHLGLLPSKASWTAGEK
jgi:hypothetical protein